MMSVLSANYLTRPTQTYAILRVCTPIAYGIGGRAYAQGMQPYASLRITYIVTMPILRVAIFFIFHESKHKKKLYKTTKKQQQQKKNILFPIFQPLWIQNLRTQYNQFIIFGWKIAWKSSGVFPQL